MQTLKLDINPKGEIPVLYVSQYDNGREFGIELVEGEEAYNVPSGYSVQLNVRKTDSKLVTKAPATIVDNIITFTTTEQMTACPGENIASISLKDTNDIVITTLYFLVSVQRDVLAGGLDSASEIHDLEQQVASIVPEVIGDDYYNKTETDALLHNKVDASVLNANYYSKWVTDVKLADKADKSELPDMNNYYDKTYIDNRFSIYRSWASTELYLDNHYYTKSQVDSIKVDDLANVDINTPSNNQVLKYDAASQKWVNGTGGGGGASDLSELDDVNITTPSNDQVLKYDAVSQKWVNGNVSGGSAHNYLTTEHEVGNWIDGTPIYERTVVLSNKATASSLTLLISEADLSALNIVSSNVIGMESIARSVNGSTRVEFIDNTYTKGNYESGLTLSFTNGSLYYQCRYANSSLNFDLYLTFRYTKSI